MTKSIREVFALGLLWVTDDTTCFNEKISKISFKYKNKGCNGFWKLTLKSPKRIKAENLTG